MFNLRHAPSPRGLCAAKIFEINEPKAKILIFEVGPKSELCLHDIACFTLPQSTRLEDQNETRMKEIGEV